MVKKVRPLRKLILSEFEKSIKDKDHLDQTDVKRIKDFAQGKFRFGKDEVLGREELAEMKRKGIQFHSSYTNLA